MSALPIEPTERDRERFRDWTKAMQFGLEYDRNGDDYKYDMTDLMFRLWWSVERERQLLQNLNMSQGCKLSELAQKLEKAEAELASLRWQEPVATLLLSYDGADFEMYYDNNKLRFEGMSMKLYAAAGAAPAVPEEWRKVMAELADDLAIEIDQNYPPESRVYPSEQRRHKGEMEIVNRARALLQSTPTGEPK